MLVIATIATNAQITINTYVSTYYDTDSELNIVSNGKTYVESTRFIISKDGAKMMHYSKDWTVYFTFITKLHKNITDNNIFSGEVVSDKGIIYSFSVDFNDNLVYLVSSQNRKAVFFRIKSGR